MLQNAYLLAKIGADTAENEQIFAKNWQLRGSSCSRSSPRTSPRAFSRATPSRCCRRSRGSGGSVALAKISGFFENFWRARSRLYQNENLQENMRLTAFFKLYKICILLHRCNLKIFAKQIGLKNQQFLWKFSKNFANVAKFAKCCQISKISAS